MGWNDPATEKQKKYLAALMEKFAEEQKTIESYFGDPSYRNKPAILEDMEKLVIAQEEIQAAGGKLETRRDYSKAIDEAAYLLDNYDIAESVEKELRSVKTRSG